jgi:hypothetical protein
MPSYLSRVRLLTVNGAQHEKRLWSTHFNSALRKGVAVEWRVERVTQVWSACDNDEGRCSFLAVDTACYQSEPDWG